MPLNYVDRPGPASPVRGRILGNIDPAATGEAMVKTLTRADDNKTIELRVGDSIVVRLPENPTTGFAWAVDNGGDGVLALDSSEYGSAAGAGIGGGGERSLTFIAIRSGTGRLQLKLWREWEGDKSIADRFAATIRVTRAMPEDETRGR